MQTWTVSSLSDRPGDCSAGTGQYQETVLSAMKVTEKERVQVIYQSGTRAILLIIAYGEDVQ